MKKRLYDAYYDPVNVGWARFQFYGDQEKAALLVPVARRQLGLMLNYYDVPDRSAQEEFMGGGFYHWHQKLPDGSTIETTTNDGHNIVRIWASSETSTPEEKKESMSVGEFLVVAGRYVGPVDILPFRWHPDEGFTLIPLTAGGYYYGEATGISWDGKRVCGRMGGDFDDEAFLWTKPEPEKGITGGTIGLGPTSFATAISGDGSTVVGHGFDDYPIWKWDAEGGKQKLSDEGKGGSATAVSYGGTLVAGHIKIPNGIGGGTQYGVIWDADGGRMLLPLPGKFDTYQITIRVTVDRSFHTSGLVIHSDYAPGRYAGDTFMPGNVHTVDNQGGTYDEPNFERLPIFPYSVIDEIKVENTFPSGGELETRTTVSHVLEYNVPYGLTVHGMSYDGQFVCGTIDGGSPGFQAFLWSANTGLNPLGFLPGDGVSVATGVSNNGKTVVGYCLGPLNAVHWFVWTAPRYDADGNLIDPGGMRSTGDGVAWAVSQSGALGAGHDATPAAVLRSRVNPKTGTIIETRINDAPVPPGSPTIDIPAEATALTYITWEVIDNDGTTLFDPDPDRVFIELDADEQVVLTIDPANPPP